LKLEVVCDELATLNMVIPGGGCQSVNIGGIAQGGGWGTHIRKFGLTCDSLLEVDLQQKNGH
jgi:FAD/FMN-containing dehydrogenase